MAVSARVKVVVAMSGGVDSSLAAALLVEQGCEVVGCFMRLGSMDDSDEDPAPPAPSPRHRGCCSVNDACDARAVADALGIPLYVLNFRRHFQRVIDDFVSEYNAGRTPNPCIRCNQWLKFGQLVEQADLLGARFVATGHYASVDRSASRPRLLRGADAAKDQSYVLFGVRQAIVDRMLLPLGQLHKHEVRRMARERGLPVHDKPDSQEICFVPDGDYVRLLGRQTPGTLAAGQIVTTDGRLLGRHAGHQHFTIGQRRGLGVALGHPAYVVGKDAATNTIYVGDRAELQAHGLCAGGANWLHPPPNWPLNCHVQIRSNGAAFAATVERRGDAGFEVTFQRPQTAVSPGQAAVCYDGPQVLGGGWISQATGAQAIGAGTPIADDDGRIGL